MWQIINEYLITYIGVLFIGIGEVLFAKISLNKNIKVRKLRFIITLLLSTLACVIVSSCMVGIVKTAFVCLVHIFEYKLLFDISYSKSIFLTFIYIILLAVAEILEVLVITSISKTYYYNSFAGSIVGNITTCIVFVLLSIILKRIIRKIINSKIETNIKIIIFSILTFVFTGIFFYNLIKELKFSDDIFLYLASIIVLLTVLFSLIRQTIENNKLTKEYDQLLEFMTTYETEIEKQRILRHEVKNEFRTIRAKICDKQKNKEIIEYIDEIVNEKYEVKREMYAKFGYLPPNGIKGLCYFKTQEAENKGITVSLNISKRIKDSTIYKLNTKEQRDFGRILGVFLDNAIEGSIESEEKKMGIEAYTNSNKEFKLIISNTYKNEIDKTKIGKESFSTKGKNRGHGLLLVKQITGSNKRFEIKTEIQEKIYIQTIIIKNYRF